MANIRDLNQRSQDSFWEWVNQMNQGLPHRPSNNRESTARHGEEAHGQEQHHEQAQREETEATAESSTEKRPSADPGTPPEEVPDDDYFFFDNPRDVPQPPPVPEGFPPGPPFGPGPHGFHGGPHGPQHHGPQRPGPFGHPHHHGGHGPHQARGGPHCRGRGAGRGHGRFGRGGAGGPFGPGFPFRSHPAHFRGGMGGRGFMPMLQKFMEQFAPNVNGANREANEDGVDFEPAIDVYETGSAYLIHVSLPGAKRDAVGVTWDDSRSALTVAGVITRDVDESIADSLAVDERDVGVFKRVVRLGDGDHPANVNADGIEAKMEDGILKVNVPKSEGYVEVKKVQIQ